MFQSKALFLSLVLSSILAFSQNSDSTINTAIKGDPKTLFLSINDSVLNGNQNRSIMIREKSKEEQDLKMGIGKLNFTSKIDKFDYDSKTRGVASEEQKRQIRKIDQPQPYNTRPATPNFTIPNNMTVPAGYPRR
jgi:hypothetical protein